MEDELVEPVEVLDVVIEEQPQTDAASRPERKKKKRWGEETEAGKKVLEHVAGGGTQPSLLPAASTHTQAAAASASALESNASLEDEEPAGKRRKSRWAPQEARATGTIVISGLPGTITLPATLAHLVDCNPETVELQSQINQVNQKIALASIGKLIDDVPEDRRSPSPEPLYNEAGARVNTRDQRIKEKLQRDRTELITEMIKRNPSFKPPSDYRPERKYRRIPIPTHDYPGYNFFGLIIGPRGNTQKRMERETNTKIAIRGRGSVKEGRAKKDPSAKSDPSDTEELHVLITGETEDALDKAADAIQRLLRPLDEGMNEHKRLQLRELASLNGTLREHEMMELQRESEAGGAEPYQLPDAIRARADEQYARDQERMNPGSAEEAGKMENEYRSFLQELGGTEPGNDDSRIFGPDKRRPGSREVPPREMVRERERDPRDRERDPRDRDPEFRRNFDRERDSHYSSHHHHPGGPGGDRGPHQDGGGPRDRDHDRERERDRDMRDGRGRDGPGRDMRDGRDDRSGPMMRREDADARAVYIGGIPPDVSEAILGRLFASIGEVREAKIIIDRFTGQSRGFGFIHYASEESANIAAERMDGYLMGSRRLTVRLKGRQGPPPPRNQAQHQPYDPASQHDRGGEPGSHPHYNQHHGNSHHPHGSHYNGSYGSQHAPPPPMGHYPSSSAWTHGTSMPTYQDDPPPGLEPDTYIHRPYDLDNANNAQITAANLADARRAAIGASGCYGFDPNLTFFWAPPPAGDEPRPPGVDLTLEEEDFQAATAAYYAYYGEQYNPYADGTNADQMTDPSQYMTEAEYASYMSDTTTTLTPDGAGGNLDASQYAAMYAEYAAATAGKDGSLPSGEDRAGGEKEGGSAAGAAAAKKGKRGTGKPQVVQLVQLNPEEVERSKKKRDEEERVRLQREREDRIKEARERARAVAAEAAAVKQEAAALRRKTGPASPSPPPPLPSQRAAANAAAAGSVGKGGARGPPPGYTHHSSSRALSPPSPARGRSLYGNNNSSGGGRRSLSPLVYGGGRPGSRRSPPPSSFHYRDQQQHSPSPQQQQRGRPISNGRSSRSPISRSPSPTYSADARPPPPGGSRVPGNNWARASLRSGPAGGVSRSPSPLPLQRLAASAAAAVAAGGPRLGQVKPERRGLRILMRTDRQDTYSPSPGPNSPAAAPPVTIKQEVVHKPVAVKIEVTGPPESSEEGELSEEEGELPSPGAAATASKAEDDPDATAGTGGRAALSAAERDPPGRRDGRGRDDYVDHMRGPPHYGSRGDDRGRERDSSRDGRPSERGGGRSRSPGDRNGLSHWERERERADWADRRGRGPPPGYRDGPSDGRRDDWGGDPRSGGGMGRERGRQMQQHGGGGGGGGGGYRDDGYYGQDNGSGYGGGPQGGGWGDGYGPGPQMAMGGAYGGFPGMGEWLGYYQAAAAGMMGAFGGAEAYAEGEEGWEEGWEEEEPAAAAVGGASAGPAAAGAQPAITAAAPATAKGPAAAGGGRGAGPGGRGPAGGAAPGGRGGYRGGSNQVGSAVAADGGSSGSLPAAAAAPAGPVS